MGNITIDYVSKHFTVQVQLYIYIYIYILCVCVCVCKVAYIYIYIWALNKDWSLIGLTCKIQACNLNQRSISYLLFFASVDFSFSKLLFSSADNFPGYYSCTDRARKKAQHEYIKKERRNNSTKFNHVLIFIFVSRQIEHA